MQNPNWRNVRDQLYFILLIFIAALGHPRVQIPLILKIFIVYMGMHLTYGLQPSFRFTWDENLTNVVQISILKCLLLIPVAFAVARFMTPKLVSYFIIADSLWLLFGGWGIGGTTFDAAVSVTLIPYIITRRGSWQELAAILLALAAAIATHSRSALVVLAVQMLFLFRKQWRYFLLLTPLLYFVFPISTNGRTSLWVHYMQWWNENVNPWVGSGLGSFEWIGLMLAPSGREARFYLLHNDWLQILFETGWIGLILSVITFSWIAVKLYADERKFILWCTFGVLAITYYPYHHILVQALCLNLILHAMKKANPVPFISR